VFNIRIILRTLALTGLVTSAFAQNISIPDPGLDAAIRFTLQKTNGPLTTQDLLSLSQLQAGNRNISDLTGLDAARNLTLLNLSGNSVTNFTLPGALTNLAILDLSFNPLAQCIIPAGFTNLTTLKIENSSLTNLTLPAGLTGLTSIELFFNSHLSSFTLPAGSPNLNLLDLGFNALTQCSLPDGLTNLGTLFLEGNALTNFTLPAGLTALNEIDLTANGLTSFALRPEMTNLFTLLIFANQLTNLTIPPNLNKLASLDLDFNHIPSLNPPVGLTNLSTFEAVGNQLTNLTFPPDMTNLIFVDLLGNQLSNLTLPDGLIHLNFLRLSQNQLTSFVLPPGMTNLTTVFLSDNQLTNVTLSSGMIRLVQIDLTTNQLTRVVLPPDMSRLTVIPLDSNPLSIFALSEPMAVSNLGGTAIALQSIGVFVVTYPVAPVLNSLRAALADGVRIGLSGPPGNYTVFSSSDLLSWTALGVITNEFGSASFIDPPPLSARKFYRTLSQAGPTNMVFIPPNTFTLGSRTNEFGRMTDEGPQTTVTLSHGFWMSKFLVTQREYLAVIGSNPSGFPGDLNRPVESVTWLDATNYCAKLTLQDLAAGRIPAGTHYRLPTEAEWECAARAGTSTQYYYGDDPLSLTNFAWYGAIGGATTKPVGLKQPNAWGLYDMEGNVWEWCQDWYGPYSGGAITDPQGPVSSALGVKVIRGGAWESFQTDCRSARRSTEAVSPFISDFIIGFRVVLVTDP
jgi:formylglycine-generating enzyme required for sulfatase activity